MLFAPEDAPFVKGWLMKKLPEISDTETDILADYVLALLTSQEGDVAQIRAGCEGELPQFLNPDAAPAFVDELFRVLEYKSYLPGAPSPPPKKKPALNPQALPFGGLPTLPQALGPQGQNGSRKRSYQDRGEIESANGADSPYNGGRAYKQPRRGGRGALGSFGGLGRGGMGRDPQDYAMQDTTNGLGGLNRPGISPGGYPAQMLPLGTFPPPPLPQGMSHFDPNYLDHLRKMQELGLPLPQHPDYTPTRQQPGRPQQPRRRRQRCRDFDIKGYCARGNSCQYDHGSEPIFVPPQGPTGPPKLDEYDPHDAAMLMSNNFQQMQQLLETLSQDRAQGGRRSRGGAKNQRRRQTRAAFSAEGPISDRSKSTIVVENIPEESFSEEAVREFFSEFGNILEVSMQPYRHLAVVKYDNWNAANAAYRSPKVVFDNRFVKVFWHKDDGDVPPSSGANGSRMGSANGFSEGPVEPEIDMDEFIRKQEEAQKAHEEKMQKKQEVEKKRQELEQRQQELLTKQREERQKLQAKLAASRKDGSEGSMDGDEVAGTSTSNALRAQLAALEEEAKLLGLDPNATDDPSYWSSPAGRGRGRGRGRGGYRARGFTPRGRGSYMGNRGDVHAAYAAYSLDNRPRKVALTGVDFTAPDKDEVLRQHLLGIGEFTDIQTTPTTTQITFKDRKTAEKFYFGIMNKSLPGIDGKVELAWVSGPLPPVASVAENDASKQQPAAVDQDMIMSNSALMSNDHQQEQPEMDYDVADEDEWGVE